MLLSLLLAGEKTWPGKSPPRVLPYCGLEEEEHRFLVYESKNAGERCGDFIEELDVPFLSCEDCTHYEKARGPEREREELRRITDVGFDLIDINSSQKGGGDYSALRDLRQRWSEENDLRRSDDMLNALETGGEMQSLPNYYPFCRRYSRGGTYVLCTVRNYHGRCPGHSEREFRAGLPLVHPSAADAAKPSPVRPGVTNPSSRPRRWREGGGF